MTHDPLADPVLVFDLGTSSLRTALVSASGRIQTDTLAQIPLHLQVDASGKAELDPLALRTAAEKALLQTLRTARAHGLQRPLSACGMSCFWHSMMGLDRQGRPLTPVLTWADSRPTEAARQLRRQWDESRLHQETGCMLRTSYWPARLVWFRQTQPATFRKVHFWVSPGEWLFQELFGARPLSLSMASGTGLWSWRQGTWHAPLLAHCQVHPEQLGLPLTQASPVPRAAPRLPAARDLCADMPLFPAIGDGAASNLGSDACAPGRVAINFGTSGAARLVLSPPSALAAIPPGLFAYHVDEQRLLVGGAISNAGNLRAWCLREFGLKEDAALEQALRRRSGPVPRLTVLPFWNRERAPTWCEDLPGVIHGLTAATTQLDLLQACTEATFHRLSSIVESLHGLATTEPTLVVSGGIQRSLSALQRMADVLGRPLRIGSEPEASLRGAGLYVLDQMGRPHLPLPAGKRVRPRTRHQQAYQQARLRQTRLESLLLPFHEDGFAD